MFLFIDESSRTIGGQKVAALGGVVIPRLLYNQVCSALFSIKKAELGARELDDCELKANTAFSKATYRHAAATGRSSLHRAVTRFVEVLDENQATVFAVWTDEPEHISIRKENNGYLSPPYVQMLQLFRDHMSRSSQRKGLIHFDQVGTKEDERVGRAVQNYIVRGAGNYQQHLLQVPVFTHSSISPGLQAADLVAYLAAGQAAQTGERQELKPMWELFCTLGIDYGDQPTIGPIKAHISERV